MVAKHKPTKGAQQQSSDQGQLIVEVDGPVHFTSNDQHRPLGSTLARNKCLQRMGFTVVTLNLTEQEVGITKSQAAAKIRQALAGSNRRRRRST
jgi:very-short-patch-repair endonuclease